MAKILFYLLLVIGYGSAQLLSNGCPVDFGIHLLLPNSQDCSKFYQCSNGERYEKQCPAGLHFDSEIQVCNWPEMVNCKLNAEPTEPSISTTTEPNRSTGCSNDGTDLLLPNLADCAKFYQCTHGVKVEFSCPDGTLFDFGLQICNWKSEVVCNSLETSSTEFPEYITTTAERQTTTLSPATDPPATVPPATDPPATEPPATDTPTTEPPATEPPATDPPAPATDPPATEPPVTDPPTTKPPATEPPVTDPPATDPPATDPPATDPPATDPPATEPPVTDPPATKPPATQPPVTDPPATDPPTTDPPATDPPTTEPPATEPPVTDPSATDPPTTDPPTTDPPATDPPTTDPPTTDPPATEPPATDPPATEPPATEPPVTDPPATEPPATEPPVTDPPATDTPTTEPPVTDPPVTDPPKTEPPVTDPPTTDPPATDPPATDPPTTEPPATNPPTTEPPATKPPVTNPPATESTVAETNLPTTTTEAPERCPQGFFGNVAHPDQCDMFFLCSGGIAIELQCSPNFEFDPNIGQCALIAEGGCTLGATDPRENELTTISPSICEPNEFTNKPHPDVCDSFYMCSGGIAIQLYCSQGFEFDPDIKQCALISENGCHANRLQ